VGAGHERKVRCEIRGANLGVDSGVNSGAILWALFRSKFTARTSAQAVCLVTSGSSLLEIFNLAGNELANRGVIDEEIGIDESRVD